MMCTFMRSVFNGTPSKRSRRRGAAELGSTASASPWLRFAQTSSSFATGTSRGVAWTWLWRSRSAHPHIRAHRSSSQTTILRKKVKTHFRTVRTTKTSPVANIVIASTSMPLQLLENAPRAPGHPGTKWNVRMLMLALWMSWIN